MTLDTAFDVFRQLCVKAQTKGILSLEEAVIVYEAYKVITPQASEKTEPVESSDSTSPENEPSEDSPIANIANVETVEILEEAPTFLTHQKSQESR